MEERIGWRFERWVTRRISTRSKGGGQLLETLQCGDVSLFPATAEMTAVS